MEVLIFILFLAIIAQRQEEHDRHRKQPCAICPETVRWVGLSKSITGWSHKDGVTAPYPGLPDSTLRHAALPAGASAGRFASDPLMDEPYVW